MDVERGFLAGITAKSLLAMKCLGVGVQNMVGRTLRCGFLSASSFQRLRLGQACLPSSHQRCNLVADWEGAADRRGFFEFMVAAEMVLFLSASIVRMSL